MLLVLLWQVQAMHYLAWGSYCPETFVSAHVLAAVMLRLLPLLFLCKNDLGFGA